LKSLGGIPVNRSVPGDVVLKIVKKIKNNPGTLFAMAPEGTRSKVSEWKSGFLRIAKEIQANVLMASIDFSAKEILLGDIYIPTGDNEKDIEEIKKYYSSFAPKYPDKF
jgi:1-acyl-sn-glycerol-3-phosphate acyltransferase